MSLSFSPSGIVKLLRYLWSLPIVRKIIGWLISALLTKVFDWLRKKRPKKSKKADAVLDC